MGKLAESFKGVIISGLDLIEQEINNCPEKLWEEMFGGDYYWDQICHAVGSVPLFLSLVGSKETVELPKGASGNLHQQANPGEPHGKQLVLDALKKSKDIAIAFFDNFDDADLLKEVNFFGITITTAGLFIFMASHIQYHVGACDAALRQNGAKAAM
jgi:hypothetical protein